MAVGIVPFLLADLVSERHRAKASALVDIFWGLGMLSGPLWAAYALTTEYGWRLAIVTKGPDQHGFVVQATPLGRRTHDVVVQPLPQAAHSLGEEAAELPRAHAAAAQAGNGGAAGVAAGLVRADGSLRAGRCHPGTRRRSSSRARRARTPRGRARAPPCAGRSAALPGGPGRRSLCRRARRRWRGRRPCRTPPAHRPHNGTTSRTAPKGGKREARRP